MQLPTDSKRIIKKQKTKSIFPVVNTSDHDYLPSLDNSGSITAREYTKQFVSLRDQSSPLNIANKDEIKFINSFYMN